MSAILFWFYKQINCKFIVQVHVHTCIASTVYRKPLQRSYFLLSCTVAPVITATSIQRPPALSGQFQSPPFHFLTGLSGHLSNVASGHKFRSHSDSTPVFSGHFLVCHVMCPTRVRLGLAQVTRSTADNDLMTS